MFAGQSSFGETLLASEHKFFVCEQVIVELFKHKEKLVRLSRISEDEILQIYKILLKHICLHKEDLISEPNRRIAYGLCKDIDESDTYSSCRLDIRTKWLAMDRR
jgi:predicted nucleic acid-binding protein